MEGSVWLTCPSYSQSLREVKARTQQERQEPWRKAVYWLAFHGLLSLLSYTIHDHLPRCGTTHSVQSLSPQLLTKRTPHRLAYMQSDRDNSSVEIPLSQMYLGLCQVDKN